MRNDDFYIGWQTKAPPKYARTTRRALLAIFSLVTIAAILLGSSQKEFSTGTFEYGKPIQLNGFFFSAPIPHLKVAAQKDIFGKSAFITIPLVGYGKKGAEDVMKELEEEYSRPLNGRALSLMGILLYNDGKLLMQVDLAEHPLKAVGKVAPKELQPAAEIIGQQVVNGEIVDPKCFFGVMKPGQGKPHKDCAIRCILGGIPPVLRTRDKEGRENFCLLLGEKGEKINSQVKNLIASPISLPARVARLDDWIILYVDPAEAKPYSYLHDKYRDAIASCEVIH